MQKARIPITNFQYGEISPSLVARTDSPIYNSSAQVKAKLNGAGLKTYSSGNGTTFSIVEGETKS